MAASIARTQQRCMPIAVVWRTTFVVLICVAGLLYPRTAAAGVPTQSITAPAAGAMISGSSVTLTCSVSGSPKITRVDFQVDATVVSQITVSPSMSSTVASTQWNSTTVTSGAHTVSCRGFNGSTGTWSSRTITVDNSAPTSLTVSAPVSGAWIRGATSFTISATDAGSLVSSLAWLVDGATLSSSIYTPASVLTKTYTWDTTTVVDGPHQLAMQAADAAGNTSNTSLTPTTVNIDNTAPTSAITSPAAAAWVGGGGVVSVAATGTDGGSGVTNASLYVDGVLQSSISQNFTASAAKNVTFSWDVSGVAAGAKALVVRFTDRTGASTDSAPIIVVVDKASPSIVQTAPSLSSFVAGSTVSLSGLASDDAGVTEIRWYLDLADGGSRCDTLISSTLYSPFLSATKTYQWNSASVADGTTRMAMMAVDGAGNQTCSSSILQFTVDNTAPDVHIDAPTGGAPVSGSASVTVSATDAAGVVSSIISIDGVPVDAQSFARTGSKAVTYTWDTTRMTLGAHVVRASFTDAAGNTTTTDATSVYVDQQAPTATTTSPAASSTIGGTIAWTVAASDDADLARVTFVLDGADVYSDATIRGTTATSVYSWDSTAISEGSHVLTAVVQDAAGRSTTSSAVTVVVSHTFPTSNIIAPADHEVVRGLVNVTAEGMDSGPVAIGLTKVEILIDSTVVSTDLINGLPMSVTRTETVDSTAVTDGSHQLRARFTNGLGVTTVDSLPIVIDNGAPSVSITAPAAGTTVKGTATIAVLAADTVGVTRLRWKVDGATVSSGAYDPFTSATKTYGLDVLTIPEGTHLLTAEAIDGAGNTTTSAAVSVTVDWSVSCTYSAVTRTVTIQLGAGESAVVYGKTDAEGGTISVNTKDCAAGTATIDNTAFINITGSSGSESVQIKGDTLEQSSSVDTYVTVNLGSGADTLTLANRFGARIHAGRNAVTGKQLVSWTLLYESAANQNADLEFSGVDNVTMLGSAARDVLDGAPYAAQGCTCNMPDPANYPMTIKGGGSSDWMRGGTAADTFVGGANAGIGTGDVVSYEGRSTVVTASIDGVANDGAAGELDNIGTDVENLIGGTAGDTLTGSAATNIIQGGGGTDAIDGAAGADALYGGLADGSGAADGADVIHGGSGKDVIYPDPNPVGGEQYFGDADVDTISYTGQTGDYTISLDDVANDGLSGETDNVHSDIENVIGGLGSDTITGSAANNVLVGVGGDGPDDTGGQDTLRGGPGKDILRKGLHHTTMSPGDVFEGGPGVDAVFSAYALTSDPLSIDLDNVADDGLVGERDNITSDVEIVFGAMGNDTLTGSAGDEQLVGLSGDDVLTGNAGKDFLDGGSGDDVLSGNAGNDKLSGGSGNDVHYGGTGTDNFIGGTGDDVFYTNDGVHERIAGGIGTDRADHDTLDELFSIEVSI